MTPGTTSLITHGGIFGDPCAVARCLLESRAIYGLTAIETRLVTARQISYWLTLRPWQATAAEGYPIEQVAITVWRDQAIAAVPFRGRRRGWLHRNPTVELSCASEVWLRLHRSAPSDVLTLALDRSYSFGDRCRLGHLCLWYRDDPLSLRWTWDMGFAAYITIVHRHLQAEEHWRRTGRWPAEDAPHGLGPHPIRTEGMRQAARPAA